MRIVREPKNALYKQYQKLFAIDGVELEFEEDAFRAVAKLALEREIGARGLRSILEGIMAAPMYDVPSDPTIEKIIITAGVVNGTESPVLIRKEENQTETA